MSKQIYAVCCYTCEHNGQETCKGCNTILNGENEPYENWQLREDLCQKDNQIADLQHKLKVAERAFNNLYEKFEAVAFEYAKMDTIPSKLHFKEQAENKLKGDC